MNTKDNQKPDDSSPQGGLGFNNEDAAVIERHPGWWFKDIFGGLSMGEKAAWLGLLYLAKASLPSGLASFFSLKNLAQYLGVKETDLAKIIKLGVDRSMLDVCEHVFVGVSGGPAGIGSFYESRIPKDFLKQLDDPDKEVSRFYLMDFPGYLQYGGRAPEGPDRLLELELSLGLEEAYQASQDIAKNEPQLTVYHIDSCSLNSHLEISVPCEPQYYLGAGDLISTTLEGFLKTLFHLSCETAKVAFPRLIAARNEITSTLVGHHKKTATISALVQ